MLVIWLQTVFSFRSYHRLGQLGPWRTAFFALYLLLVGSLIFNIYFAWQIHQKLPAFIQSVPTLTFEKGRLTAPAGKTTVYIPGTEYKIIFQAAPGTLPTQQDFAAQKILAWVQGDSAYMLSVGGLSKQTIPSSFSAQITPEWLAKQAPAARSFLQTIIFFGSLLALGFFLVFSILMAGAVIYFWRGMTRSALPIRTLWKWAILLQGPALVLWTVQLLAGVPLFAFALFILFNIYVQQIFNTLPDK